METFSYYYIIIWAGLALFGAGISFANIGIERKPITAGSAILGVILTVIFVISCCWMKKPE